MKVRLQKVQKEQEEIIIRYQNMTSEIEDIVRYLEGKNEKLIGTKDGSSI